MDQRKHHYGFIIQNISILDFIWVSQFTYLHALNSVLLTYFSENNIFSLKQDVPCVFFSMATEHLCAHGSTRNDCIGLGPI